jgi:hypothetical protein
MLDFMFFSGIASMVALFFGQNTIKTIGFTIIEYVSRILISKFANKILPGRTEFANVLQDVAKPLSKEAFAAALRSRMDSGAAPPPTVDKPPSTNAVVRSWFSQKLDSLVVLFTGSNAPKWARVILLVSVTWAVWLLISLVLAFATGCMRASADHVIAKIKLDNCRIATSLTDCDDMKGLENNVLKTQNYYTYGFHEVVRLVGPCGLFSCTLGLVSSRVVGIILWSVVPRYGIGLLIGYAIIRAVLYIMITAKEILEEDKPQTLQPIPVPNPTPSPSSSSAADSLRQRAPTPFPEPQYTYAAT